ncbi:MAG: hypothetical protein AABX19_00040 [Nanoarchaeota archaeon]
MDILTFKDRYGTSIYLSDERWKHITSEHPIVANKIEEIRETLLNPTTVMNSYYDYNVKYYYKYLKQEKKYLLVIVKYLNKTGYIITSYHVDIIKGIK